MQPRTSQARQTIASVATAVVATIVALGICELTLRLWDGIPLRPIDIIAYKASFVTREAAAEYDSLLGWRHKANRGDPTSNITGDYGVRMNSGTIKPLPAHAILAVGDSFTAGADVAEHESYVAQLEAMLGYPVINGGVGGYGTDQMILAAERLIPLLHPAGVIVGILDDDIDRAAHRTFSGAPKPWFEVRRDGELVHHNNPVPPPVPRSENDSAPWFAYSDLAIWVMGRLGRGDLRAIRAGNYEPVDNDPVAVTCALLRRLNRETEAEHIHLLVFMIYPGNVDEKTLARAAKREYAVPVTACARDAGIETLDLWDELLRVMRDDPTRYRGLYLRYGPRQDGWGHMSAAGNAFIAQQIAQRLAARGWLPPLIQDASVKDAGSGGGPLDRHER
jgi:lysophospholipase L1-like esterase